MTTHGIKKKKSQHSVEEKEKQPRCQTDNPITKGGKIVPDPRIIKQGGESKEEKKGTGVNTAGGKDESKEHGLET